MKIRGFTLLELLFVVATIAILAAIAVPNFLEAQVRSKVSRTLHDMAAMDAALRAYEADYRVYPPNHLETRMWVMAASQVESGSMVRSLQAMREVDPEDDIRSQNGLIRVDRANRLIGGGSSGWFSSSQFTSPVVISGYDLARLTTPIAYFTQDLATDTFADTRSLPFGYLNLQVVANSPRSRNGSFEAYVRDPAGNSNQPIPTNQDDPFGLMEGFSDDDIAELFAMFPPVQQPTAPDDYYITDPDDGDPIMRSYPQTTSTTRTMRLVSDRYLLYSFGPSANQSRVSGENLLWDPIIPYDPTNGTVSSGLIYTTGHGIRRHGALGGHVR